MASLLGSVLSSVGKSAPQISKNYYDTKIAMWREQNLMDRERYQQDQLMAREKYQQGQLNLRHDKEMGLRGQQLEQQTVDNLYQRYSRLNHNLEKDLQQLAEMQFSMSADEYNAELEKTLSEYRPMFNSVETQLAKYGHTLRSNTATDPLSGVGRKSQKNQGSDSQSNPPSSEPAPRFQKANAKDESPGLLTTMITAAAGANNKTQTSPESALEHKYIHGPMNNGQSLEAVLNGIVEALRNKSIDKRAAQYLINVAQSLPQTI